MEITVNKFWIILLLILCSAILYFILNKLNKHLSKTKNKKYLFIILIIGYVLACSTFIGDKYANNADQLECYKMASSMYNKTTDIFLTAKSYIKYPEKKYFQLYPQNLTLSVSFYVLFKIFHSDSMVVIHLFNIFCNCTTIVFLYKIGKLLAKKYSNNITRILLYMSTFIPIIMLSNFLYGDLASIACGITSIYFMMKYFLNNEKHNFFISCIIISIGYIIRMNSVIWVIATGIYIILNMKNKSIKQKISIFIFLLLYLAISIFPANIVKNIYMNKYNLEKGKTQPIESFLYMAMQESSARSNGWYNEDVAEFAFNHREQAKVLYRHKIKQRLSYFVHNPKELFKFYFIKIASTWSENTYGKARTLNFFFGKNVERFVEFYQKVIFIMISSISIIFLIQNKKDISNEILLLLTIFIGGFLFHILWETKSRYILPYIVVLMPIGGMNINIKFSKKIMQKFNLKKTDRN